MVLDATWRKSRKMLYLNPGLQALPRLALQGDLPASRYGALRKAHAPGQLSTLEAAACALQRLAPAGPSLQPLRDAGLTDQEILDMLHSAALFGWANRLMLNLGKEKYITP